MRFKKHPIRCETYAERAKREEVERQRGENKRVFQVLELMPPDFVCSGCQSLPYALFCHTCTQKVKEKAGVKCN